jgi:glutaryl-CoA dehydrogenase
LPNKSGLGHLLGCLDSAYGIAWGAIGGYGCYDTALRYAKERIQFDKTSQERNYSKRN